MLYEKSNLHRLLFFYLLLWGGLVPCDWAKFREDGGHEGHAIDGDSGEI